MEKELKSLIEALKNLRHDQIDEKAVEMFQSFYRSGFVAEFYIATMGNILEAMQEAKRREDEKRTKVLDMIRRQREAEKNKEN